MSKPNAWRPFTFLANAYVALLAVHLVLFADYNHLLQVNLISFYVISGGFVALMLLFSLESIAVGMMKPKELLQKLAPASLVQWFFLGYLIFSLVSALLSAYPDTWIGATRNEGFLTVAIYVLSFYFVAKFARPEKWMMYAFGAAVSIFCIISILQLAGLPILYPDGMNYYEALEKDGVASIGTIGNVDFAAALLALVIPTITVYIVKAKEKYRFLLLIPAVLSIVVLLKIWVLLGFIGVAAAAVVAFPYVLGFKKRAAAVYFAALPFLALAAVVILYAMPFKSGFFFELHSILHGQISENFGSGRIRIWQDVISRIPDHFFFGTGPDTMLYAGIEPFHRYDEVEGWIVRYIDTAHNDYLNILYHQGIFALLSYLGAVIAFGISFVRNACKNPGALILGAGIIGYLAAMLFGISMPFTTIFFWLCLGLYECFTSKDQEQTHPAKGAKNRVKTRSYKQVNF